MRGLARAAYRAQQIERFRQGELFAYEGVQEAAAAHLAARLHAAQRHQQVAPRGRQRLPGGRIAERIVRSSVTFYDDIERRLDWYLATGEPRGKAGGYAVQGAASIFISRIEGSLSNVIGLPLRELFDVLTEHA